MDAHNRLTAKERGSYLAYLKNPNVSKLSRTSLYRRKKTNKQATGESPTDSFLARGELSGWLGNQNVRCKQ